MINLKFYDFSAKKMNWQEIKMEEFKGKVVLIVNTASKCGLTPQFIELEELYKEYKYRGFEILGFPCNQFAKQDPESNKEIKWNFGKFLIYAEGNIIKRYAPITPHQS